MKLTLVAAIRYLEKNQLPSDKVISLELWGDEGYQLQAVMKNINEGATSLAPHPLFGGEDFYASAANSCNNSQFNCLMSEIGKADLAIQFVNSFPTWDNDEGDGLNLRVIVMHRKTLQEALAVLDRHFHSTPAPKASSQRSATALRTSERRGSLRFLKTKAA